MLVNMQKLNCFFSFYFYFSNLPQPRMAEEDRLP